MSIRFFFNCFYQRKVEVLSIISRHFEHLSRMSCIVIFRSKPFRSWSKILNRPGKMELQMSPIPKYIDWLEEGLNLLKPFSIERRILETEKNGDFYQFFFWNLSEIFKLKPLLEVHLFCTLLAFWSVNKMNTIKKRVL